jgi:hypothetical protein|tara:strand:- start:496 stop:1008 length:513 start_codon:yes stop_codon:yes gene_type:complete
MKNICEWSKCKKTGVYKAPVEKDNSKKFKLLCLEHIKVFNKSWNYFADMKEEEIENFIKSDLTWHKPTKSFGSSENFFRILWVNALDDKPGMFKDSIFKNFKKSKLSDKDRDALKILGLKNDTNWSDIQKRFKILVKKYHPDKNRGSRKYEDILKKITLAYSQLRLSMSK